MRIRGVCFYRLDEPNAGDTFRALASLAILDALPDEDNDTRTYLHAFQRPDGSFTNVPVGHAVIRSLNILGERPSIDPTHWILSSMLPPGDSPAQSNQPPSLSASISSRRSARFWALQFPLTIGQRSSTLCSSTRHPDTGFGHLHSTIIETGHALAILAVLGYPVSLSGSTEFLKRCEDLSFSFLAVPDSKPTYLEHVHAGVLACSVIGYHSPVFDQCEEFIRKCWRENGGYVRSIFGGSPTLENTYLALDALIMIECSEENTKSQKAGNPL